MPVEIRDLRLPAGEHAGGDDELAAYAALIRRLDVESLGTAELSRDVAELAVLFAGDPYTAHRPLGAFDDGRLVGLAELQWELDADAETAYVTMLGVAPERRRAGIGAALLAAAERVAADAGRPTTVLSGEHLIAADPGDGHRLRAPQGDASIAAADPAAAFASARGYALGQLDRVSVLDVDGRAAEFRGLAAAASAEASDGYRLVPWRDHAPDDLVASLARAHERMSVDAPAGAIAYEFEPWDALRVRDDERRAIATGRSNLTVAAVAPDGEVAGYTQLSLLPGSPAVEQWDTIVLAAHRGHRLGMRLKLANLVALAEADAARSRVYTWNADENAHMLAINVALGFRPFALESVWQRPTRPGAS
ncbi:GNAT family N-acetyltransferase [Agromyces sp. MMS24-JH15]|uniref:GNAT family N-acetyltransferase n=1 Tax=Agromyces sp. MMS24-JH15 TaxID=3243765 RepID=UPI0037498D79